MKADGGVTVEVNLTTMDLAILEHLKVFYREVFNIDVSTDVIIRSLINEHIVFIDEVIRLINEGVPVEVIPMMEYAQCQLCLSTYDHDGVEDLPEIQLDDQGNFPTFSERRNQRSAKLDRMGKQETKAGMTPLPCNAEYGPQAAVQEPGKNDM